MKRSVCFIRSKHFRRLTALLCTLAPTLAPAVLAAEPVATENINDQDNRTIQTKGEFSFLYANGSGGVTHAEHLRSGKILVEDYDASFRCLSRWDAPRGASHLGRLLRRREVQLRIHRPAKHGGARRQGGIPRHHV